jgi:hypothetical protein
LRTKSSFVFGLCGLLLLGCSDDLGDNAGTPISPARPDATADATGDGRTDGGDAADARDATRVTDAPGSGDAGDTAAMALPTTGAGAACDTCERRQCTGDFVAKCVAAFGWAKEGARKDTPRAQLCGDVLGCIRRTACAATSVRDCYCGMGVSEADCMGGQASGPCKSEIEGGAESSDPKVVVPRLYDPNFATGSAFTLIEACDRPSCLDVCRLKAPVGSSGGSTCTMPPADTGEKCPDLDGNCTPDCRETLAQNPGFRVDATNWGAETNGTVGWDTNDAAGLRTSGSLAVANTRMSETAAAILTGARQCITGITAGARYELLANVFIAAGQSAGSAGVFGEFYASADCTGAPLKSELRLHLAGKSDAWLTVGSDSAAAPDAAKSLLVRLLVSKSSKLPPLRVLFDNVLVGKR